MRRTYIPKADGRPRPLGVTVLEDKIVQRATVDVLNAVYEVDFVGFSYGFRPVRSPHMALDALAVGIQQRKVNWVLGADLRGCFDAIDEEGQWRPVEVGVPQASSVGPLLANDYLHYAFDLWAQARRRRHARGDVILVRFADDMVCGFQHRSDADRFQAEFRARLAKFGLEVNPEKTRRVEFGRFAAANRRRRGERKPETFDFLGFTHSCDRTRKGKVIVLRQTQKKSLRRKLKEVKAELRRRLHDPWTTWERTCGA